MKGNLIEFLFDVIVAAVILVSMVTGDIFGIAMGCGLALGFFFARWVIPAVTEDSDG